MEERKAAMSHRFVLENRKSGTLTGIRDVKSFDEKLVLLATDWGGVTIKGEGLHMSLLDLEKGEVELTGRVDSIAYTEKGVRTGRKGESLIGRLFQ